MRLLAFGRRILFASARRSSGFERKSSTQLKAKARANVEQSKEIAIGVDIGGTFTDVILVDERIGIVYSAKVLTTPERPAQGVDRYKTAYPSFHAFVVRLSCRA